MIDRNQTTTVNEPQETIKQSLAVLVDTLTGDLLRRYFAKSVHTY